MRSSGSRIETFRGASLLKTGGNLFEEITETAGAGGVVGTGIAFSGSRISSLGTFKESLDSGGVVTVGSGFVGAVVMAVVIGGRLVVSMDSDSGSVASTSSFIEPESVVTLDGLWNEMKISFHSSINSKAGLTSSNFVTAQKCTKSKFCLLMAIKLELRFH